MLRARQWMISLLRKEKKKNLREEPVVTTARELEVLQRWSGQ